MAGVKSSWISFFPITGWLPSYRLPDLRWDTIAGITLAFFVIPESMAYASLAGLPPQSGIYCYLFAGLLYMIFGTSKQLAIGPTSSMSIVIGSAIGIMAGNDPVKAVAIASGIAILVAIFYFIAWLIRLSSLVNFISDTILVGFKAGAALVIASTQLPKLFGVTNEGSTFLERIWHLLQNLGESNPFLLVFGFTSLLLLIAGNHFLKGKPVSLIIVILSILLAGVAGFESHGIHLVGPIPKGIPGLHLPLHISGETNEIFFLGLACFFLSYVESITAARTLARKNGYEVNPRQELIALGFSNLASGLGTGYTVAGGLSQSTVNDRSGAKSLLSLLIATIILSLCLIFLSGLFRNMPEVILSVIVLDAVIGLINVKEMKQIWKISRTEFWIMILSLISVLLFGVLQGILLAAVLSIISLLRKSSVPHIGVLGRIPGTSVFSDIQRHADNETIPGVLILRPESSILYYNTSYLREKMLQLADEAGPGLTLMILDLSVANFVDISGVRFLLQLKEDIGKRNITLRIVEALGNVRDILRAEGMEQEIGHISRKTTIDDILREFSC